jgi:hypothetical protein
MLDVFVLFHTDHHHSGFTALRDEQGTQEADTSLMTPPASWWSSEMGIIFGAFDIGRTSYCVSDGITRRLVTQR